jgi:tetratricopeptide (TPR) repeat protein
MSLWSIGASGLVRTTTADLLFSALGSDKQSQMQTLAQTALARGADKYTSGDYKGAALAFRSAVALDPSHDNAIKAFNLMATAYLQANDTADAMKAYKSSISMAPDDDSAHVKLGNIYFSQQDYVNAEKEYTMAVRISPTSSTNILSLGQAYLAEGKFSDAERQFQQVIKMDPAHESGYYALGQTYSKEGRYNDAIAQFQKVVSIKSDFYQAYVDLGSAYADLKQPDKAQEQLDVLNKNKPDLAPLLSQYIDTVTNPKFASVYSPNGFSTQLGPGTHVYNLNWSLAAPNATKLFTMVFTFSKEMDPLSVQNPYNWSITQSQTGSPGGPYNWGLPIQQTDVGIAPIPLSVAYDTSSASATVSFLVKQNSTGTGTLDPSHIMFKFSGKDIFGNAMDTSADEFGGISQIV